MRPLTVRKIPDTSCGHHYILSFNGKVLALLTTKLEVEVSTLEKVFFYELKEDNVIWSNLLYIGPFTLENKIIKNIDIGIDLIAYISEHYPNDKSVKPTR